MRNGLLLGLLVCVALAGFAQNAAPPAGGARPVLSPRGQAEFAFADGKKIVVDYGRPFMRGRKIMGELVPYGKVWRTGANAATGLVTDADVMVAGVNVPAGKYTLYTVPGEQEWTIIINKQTGQWGLRYDEAQDLVRVRVKAAKLEPTMDQFTIRFAAAGTGAVTMKLEWENTSVPVEIQEAK
jgi:hypothetical protein